MLDADDSVGRDIPREQPVAGRPPDDLVRTVNHLPPPPQVNKPQDSTVEMPIFREMEAAWFRSHGRLDLGQSGASDTSGTGSGGSAATATVGSSRTDNSGPVEWRTAADAGWSAAAAAARPPIGGSTRSGLPKRVPQAQYVPGSVEGANTTPSFQRRSPDEIRGLLSAYHRGVQRGRQHGGR